MADWEPMLFTTDPILLSGVYTCTIGVKHACHFIILAQVLERSGANLELSTSQ
jgi:hypothetical protein